MKEIDPVAENCSLANITLLQTLSEEARSAIERKCSWIEFDPNDVILDRVGDDQHEVFFLVRGTVRIMNFAGDRQEIALADLEEGSNFGELSAVDCRGRSARVLGSENCIIARLDREDFIGMAWPPI